MATTLEWKRSGNVITYSSAKSGDSPIGTATYEKGMYRVWFSDDMRALSPIANAVYLLQVPTITAAEYLMLAVANDY